MAQEDLIGRTFVELADTLVEGYDLIDFLQLLSERCVTVLAIAEAGVVLTGEDGNLSPLASSSERMRLVELIELQRNDGPCLDCWRSGVAVREDDLDAARDRWPRFGPAALEAGFRSVYALPMRLRDHRIGALNLFSDHRDGLSREDERLGQAMADVATIGILNERVLQEREVLAAQLQHALTSRVRLEQARGVVAEQAGVDMEAAFDLIRSFARSRNLRLGDVAGSVLDRSLSAAELRA